MSIYVSEGDQKPILLAPPGTHQAVCYNIWELGLQEQEFQGKKVTLDKIMFGWELNEIIPEGDFDGKRFVATKTYTKSLWKKANLFLDLTSWRGKPFTTEELKKFDIEKMIGVNCMLNVVHVIGKSGREYVKVAGVLALPKGLSTMKAENERTTPKWIQEIIDKQFEPFEPVRTTDGEEVPF